MERALHQSYDAAVIGGMLPKRDGLSTIDRSRLKRIRTPVLDSRGLQFEPFPAARHFMLEPIRLSVLLDAGDFLLVGNSGAERVRTVDDYLGRFSSMPSSIPPINIPKASCAILRLQLDNVALIMNL